MRYILGFLITLGLIILLFVWIFSGGNGEEAPQVERTRLVDYADTSVVMQYTVDHRINYKDEHRQEVTTVGRDSVTFQVLEGYSGQVLRTSTYDNTEEAYASFLLALDRSGYTNGNPDEALRDERGFCPQGRRYIFEIQDGSRVLQHYWDTSCRGTQTFEGQTSAVRSLFRLQVPEYRELTRGTGL